MKLCYLGRDNDAAPADEMCKNDNRSLKEQQQQLFIKRVLKAKGCDRIDDRCSYCIPNARYRPITPSFFVILVVAMLGLIGLLRARGR